MDMDIDRFNAMKGSFKVQPGDGGTRNVDPRDIDAAKEAHITWWTRLLARLRR